MIDLKTDAELVREVRSASQRRIRDAAEDALLTRMAEKDDENKRLRELLAMARVYVVGPGERERQLTALIDAALTTPEAPDGR